MATDNAPDFDLGPLSWVQGEIDQALGRGLDSLAAFQANPGDGTELKHARTHVHQAAGAIQMVGLDAVVAFTDEIERQLGRLDELAEPERKSACAAIDRACRKLRIFLVELVGGSPPVPLKLFPEYEAMQRARGVKAAAPTDLFFPDLAPRAPKLSMPQVVPAAKLPSYMVKQRRQYQRGLLAWLRGDEEGAKTMRDAIAAIEDATTHQNLRAFWWTSGALFDALNERGLEGGFGVKQLAARIDLQIRRVVEGSAKVADRLRREVLYYVAIAAPVTPSVQAVQKGFKLGGLIPSAEVLNSDLVRIQPLLRDARDQLATAKDSWLKFTSGRAENLPKLKQTLSSVHKCAAEIGNGALMKLTAGLVERLDKMPTSSVSEPLAMEYATGLLLAESAADGYANLGTEFPKQVEAMLSRIDAARASRPPPAGTAAPMLDEMSRRAQERLLLAQVGREIQANLRHMEQVLDAFFRDNGKRAELGALAKDSTQIRGALTMLGLDDAERLLALCQEQIAAYADPETPVSNDELELLAESLSGLGFYIEAVEQQRPDRDRLIAPLLARRLGEAPAPVADDRGESVEEGVEALRATLPALVEEMRRAPADVLAREALKARLTNLRDDAELIGDADLVTQAASALKELDAGGAALAAAVDAIAESQAAPTPVISEETQRLLATEQLDGELLEIYLAEAAEVIDAIGENHATLRGNPGDREALRNVRRAFHTLKGSGRMVGLTELGDIAHDVEKLHNRLLDEDRPVTAAVLSLIGQARDDFRHWVDGLSAQGRVHADPSALHAAIRAVEDELPAGRESVLTPTPPAPVDEAPAAAAPAVQDAAPIAVQAQAEASALPPLAEEAPPAVEGEVLPVVDEPRTPDEGFPVVGMVELPELGSGGAAPGVLPVLEVPDFSGSDDAELVADDVPAASTLVAPPPSAPAPAPVESAAVATGQASVPVESAAAATGEALASDDISVGGVVLSASLFEILVAEADQHLATLRHETQLLQFDPAHPVSHEMVRASHTLCGIHRTGGFPAGRDHREGARTDAARSAAARRTDAVGGAAGAAARSGRPRHLPGAHQGTRGVQRARRRRSGVDSERARGAAGGPCRRGRRCRDACGPARGRRRRAPRRGARRRHDSRARRGRRDGGRAGDTAGSAAGARRGTRGAGRGRVTRAAAGSARRRARRRRSRRAADIPRGSGRTPPAGRRAGARLAPVAAGQRRFAAVAAHASHVQGERADGGRDAPGRTHPPDGKPHPRRRRHRGSDARIVRGAGYGPRPDRVGARRAARRAHQCRTAMGQRGEGRGVGRRGGVRPAGARRTACVRSARARVADGARPPPSSRPLAEGHRTGGGFAGIAGIRRHGPARRRLHRAGGRRAARHRSALPLPCPGFAPKPPPRWMPAPARCCGCAPT